MSFVIYFIFSFASMILIGVIVYNLMASLFGKKLGGLLGGLLTSILSFLMLQYLHEHVYPKSIFTLGKKVTILVPLVLNGLRILRVGLIQDKTGEKTYGELPIEMPANKLLGIGYVLGALVSLFR